MGWTVEGCLRPTSNITKSKSSRLFCNQISLCDKESVIQHNTSIHDQTGTLVFHMLFTSFDPTIDIRPATMLENFTVDINKLKEKLVLPRILQAQPPANIVDFTGI